MIATQEIKEPILRGMPDHARVWIYQSTRPFTETEVVVLTSQINGFVGEWTAHRKTLLAAAAVFYNQFIVLSVDESLNEASGCSIDASVYFIKDIENQYNVQLFERMNFAYLEGDVVKTVSSNEARTNPAAHRPHDDCGVRRAGPVPTFGRNVGRILAD